MYQKQPMLIRLQNVGFEIVKRYVLHFLQSNQLHNRGAQSQSIKIQNSLIVRKSKVKIMSVNEFPNRLGHHISNGLIILPSFRIVVEETSNCGIFAN